MESKKGQRGRQRKRKGEGVRGRGRESACVKERIHYGRGGGGMRGGKKED